MDQIRPEKKKMQTEPLERLGDELDNAGSTSVDRRSMLRTMLKVSEGAVTGNIPKMVRALKDVSEEKSPDRQYAETISQTALLALGNVVSIAVFKKLGYKVGNAGTDQEYKRIQNDLREKPIETFMTAAVIFPTFEELLFRGIPQAILARSDEAREQRGEKRSLRWDVGIPLSAVFAGIHNFTEKGFSTDTIPLPQFLGGVFLWYLTRERGFDHAVLAHAENNTIALSKMLLETYP